MTNFSKIIVQIVAVFLLAVIVVNADWSAPTASPPNANTPAPVNVGSTTQEKAGILGVGAFSSFGDAFFGGNMKLSPGTSGNTFEFGYGVSGKEMNAGRIGYERWTTGALDVVGAGTQAGSRKVKIWDVLDAGSLCLNGDCKTAWSQVGGSTSSGGNAWVTIPGGAYTVFLNQPCSVKYGYNYGACFNNTNVVKICQDAGYTAPTGSCRTPNFAGISGYTSATGYTYGSIMSFPSGQSGYTVFYCMNTLNVGTNSLDIGSGVTNSTQILCSK